MISQESSRPSSVLVVHGAASDRFDIAGVTIGDVRRQLRTMFNIPAEADAFLNGEQVDDDVALKDQDTLEFVKAHGRKGGLPDFWSENELIAFFGESNVKQMQNTGLKMSLNPTISMEEVMAWSEWLQKQDAPPKRLPVSVHIEDEALTYKGKTFSCDRTLCIILQCLIDAGGEIRSTTDIQRAYPDEPWEDRLQQTIKRKLFTHPSGVGELVQSVQKRGYRLRVENVLS